VAVRLLRLLQTASCFLLPLVVSTIVGCASGSAQRGEAPHEGLLPQTIIDLTRQGMPPETINAQIDETHSVYILNTAEVARLQAAGVDNRVIDHMMATAARASSKGKPLWYRQGQFYASPPFAAYTGPYRFSGKGLLDDLVGD
jgi:hypothetical protein